MAKAKSFADKVNKKDFSSHCAECGETITAVKYITSERSEKTGAWKFIQKFVGLCKCNENELIS